MKSAFRVYLPLLAVVAMGSALRFLRIGAEGLWIDEAFSVWLARRPLAEMLRWVATVDHHPPLYYALLHGWIRLFGDGEASARSLSALMGSLTLPVAYLLGRRVGNQKVGVLSALILAVSPFHVQFGQEARMYALLTLSGSVALYCAIVLVGGDRGLSGHDGEPPGCPLPWIGYVVCTVTMLWTHNAAVLFALALNLCVLGAAKANAWIRADGMRGVPVKRLRMLSRRSPRAAAQTVVEHRVRAKRVSVGGVRIVGRIERIPQPFGGIPGHVYCAIGTGPGGEASHLHHTA